MPRRHFLGLIPGMALAVSGCSQQTTGPVEIKWGRDTCDYCGMVIDEPRFAAQLRGGANRKVYKFDDLGDAVLFLVKQDWANDPATEFWVGGLEIAKGQWLDGLKAFYLSGQRSPMAHGFGAVADQREGTVDFTRMKGMVVARGSTSRCEPTSNAEGGTENRG
jgi:nitrous oxide reductase accessory protein NosL